MQIYLYNTFHTKYYSKAVLQSILQQIIFYVNRINNLYSFQ